MSRTKTNPTSECIRYALSRGFTKLYGDSQFLIFHHKDVSNLIFTVFRDFDILQVIFEYNYTEPIYEGNPTPEFKTILSEALTQILD